MILCRLCARLSHVRPCTLLSAFTQAPRLTRNCFPNGSERAIHCRAYGFSRSCTSLYTPVEKSAPSAPCARLRRKRQYNCVILCRLYARLSRVRLRTLLSAFAQAPRLTRNCFPNGANAQSIVGFARGCGVNDRQFPRDTLSPFGVTMSAMGAADAPCPPRAWSARSILQSKRRVVRYENRRRH